MYMNWMDFSHLQFGTLVSRLITHTRYFASSCTLL